MVDLSIINRLMAELQSLVNKAESLDLESQSNKIEYVVEMNKAAGLTAGILAESGLLMGDIHHAIQQVQPAAAESNSTNDLLSKILGGKGPHEAN